MKDKEPDPLYAGKWTPENGFEPPDLENLIPAPTDGQPMEIFIAPHHGRVNVPFVESWEEGDLERFERAVDTLDAARMKLQTATIEIAPGYRLHCFLGSLCPPAFRERELDALHADSVALYLEKLQAGDKWGAWRLKHAMRFWMVWTVFGGAVTAASSMFWGKQKPSK